MAKVDAVEIWSLNYRLLTAVIAEVAPAIADLGLEVKELFVLAEIGDFPHPAALAERLSMPKPTITVYLKKLEAAGFVRREIDPTDLRRHRLQVTTAGGRIMTRGLALLSQAFGDRLARVSTAEQNELAKILAKIS